MIYKFVSNSMLISCDKVLYAEYIAGEYTIRDLDLYVGNKRIGSVNINEYSKIEYQKSQSTEYEKVYYVNSKLGSI